MLTNICQVHYVPLFLMFQQNQFLMSIYSNVYSFDYNLAVSSKYPEGELKVYCWKEIL